MLPTPNAQALLIMSALAMLTAQMRTRECSGFRRGMMRMLGPMPAKVCVLGHEQVDVVREWKRAANALRRGCEQCPRRAVCKKPLA